MIAFEVLLVTDPAYDAVAITRAALSAAPPGRVAVMARDKAAGARELAALARALLPICRGAGAPLLVNDRCDVARAVGADGVHLPERGLGVADARVVLGPGATIGASRHGPPREPEAPDYVTLGPVGHVPDKGPALDLDAFAGAARAWRAPVFALGGVEPGLVPELVRRGARGVAVIRTVYGARDPAHALGALLEALGARS